VTGESIRAELLRIRTILFLMLGALAVLVGALLWLQVVCGHEYESSLRKQSMRRIRLSAARGRIFDRWEVCLADNQPRYCLALYLEEMRRPGKWSNTVAGVSRTLQTLTGIMGRPPLVTEADIWLHIRRRLPLPLVAWRNLDPAALARLAEQPEWLDGVDVFVEPERHYPRDGLAAHVMGYVGKADLAEEAEVGGYQFYLPEMEGKAGIERVFNGVLAGEPGGRLVRIDASGFKHAENIEREPRPGADVVLALDARVQTLAEAALQGTAGAVVVLDPDNGDVLALASSPGFNINQFVPVLTKSLWDEANSDPEKRLLNRAVAEVYAPGSVFKPLVAIAALETGRVSPATTFDCTGRFERGGFRMGCWNLLGHGPVSLRRGIEQSCNVYFASAGLQCGYEAIEAVALGVGLGQKTGIALDGEARGLVPNDAWKRRVYKDGWRFGDTCNVSIGQGPLTVTPLQMAVVAATLANGGTLYRPRLVLGVRDRDGSFRTNMPPVVVRRLGWSPATLAVVRGGMQDVVMAPTGTGKRARIEGVAMAGKTGTAEFGEKGSGKKHGWMLIFAPFDHPRYAAAMVVDEAVSGGLTVGPRMHDLMDGIFHGTEAGG
jgi:penicillin-binding protein 2